MSAPQLREEDGITFVLLDGGLDSDVSSQGEFCFEEVSRGLSSPASIDENDFIRYDSLDKLPSIEPATTLPTSPNQQPKSKGRRKSRKPKNARTVVSQQQHGIKLPSHHDPPQMPLKHNKTYTMEFNTEYDIVGNGQGDANIIYFALEDTGKLGGLSEVFKSYKFMRVVALFSRIHDGPLNGTIYTTLLHKDSKVPTKADVSTMKADNTCMEVDMAVVSHFTRSITPRFTPTRGKALNEWLPITNASSNVTWFGIKYITDPTPDTSSLYLVSLKYTIAFRA